MWTRITIKNKKLSSYCFYNWSKKIPLMRGFETSHDSKAAKFEFWTAGGTKRDVWGRQSGLLEIEMGPFHYSLVTLWDFVLSYHPRFSRLVSCPTSHFLPSISSLLAIPLVCHPCLVNLPFLASLRVSSPLWLPVCRVPLCADVLAFLLNSGFTAFSCQVLSNHLDILCVFVFPVFVGPIQFYTL